MPTAPRELEVLKAIMEKVKLKKENYITLMKGMNTFIHGRDTQKQAYKLLAMVIEKYEIANVSELMQI